MASSPSHLYEATPQISNEDQAHLARTLLSANELYIVWNSNEASREDREQALHESRSLTSLVLDALPEHPGALNLMARIAVDNYDFDEAEALIKKARNNDGNNPTIYWTAAYLCMAKRDYAAAELQFNKTLELDRGNEQAFAGIALAKLRSKDYPAALSHYHRLIQLGYDKPAYRQLLTDSLEHLVCDQYSKEHEELLLLVFSWPDVEHQKLGNMATSLIAKKYDLSNDQAILDLDTLLTDPLLQKAVSTCLLTSVEVEGLLVELRRSIFLEVCMTQTLRDEVLPMAIALGCYAARCDYALASDDEQECGIARLATEILAATKQAWTCEDVAGALITVAMYESLYSQAFSFALLAYDLEHWSPGIQTLMQASLYDLCEEHDEYCAHFGIDATQLTNNDFARASERWTSLPRVNRSQMYVALSKVLDHGTIPERFKTDTLNILIIGCGSGERAAYLANSFANVQVYGVDSHRENVAYASRQARLHNIDNVHFIHGSYETAIITEELFDIIEFNEALNHADNIRKVISEWKLLLQDDGLLRFDFASHAALAPCRVIQKLVKDRRLSPTRDNITHLRHAIMQESQSGLWEALFSDPRFYTTAGCRELFFHRSNNSFDLKQIDSLLKSEALSFIGFSDIDRANREQTNLLAPYSLLAWHVMDQDGALFKDMYSLYCVPEA